MTTLAQETKKDLEPKAAITSKSSEKVGEDLTAQDSKFPSISKTYKGLNTNTKISKLSLPDRLPEKDLVEKSNSKAEPEKIDILPEGLIIPVPKERILELPPNLLTPVPSEPIQKLPPGLLDGPVSKTEKDKENTKKDSPTAELSILNWTKKVSDILGWGKKE